MLTIRLQRMGKAKKPSYRFVVSENARDTQAKALELLGTYVPTQQPKILDIKRDRVEYWLSRGAQTSETVHNLFIKEGIITADKRKAVTISKKRAVKLDAKRAEVEEKKKAAAEAKAQAEAEAAAATEAPVEEVTEDVPADTAEEKTAE